MAALTRAEWAKLDLDPLLFFDCDPFAAPISRIAGHNCAAALAVLALDPTAGCQYERTNQGFKVYGKSGTLGAGRTRAAAWADAERRLAATS